MRMRWRLRKLVGLGRLSPALVGCVVLGSLVQKLRGPPLVSQFASRTAAAGAVTVRRRWIWYRDQRTWPAFKPRARPLFCLTSLGMFAVVLVDDVRYKE